jgi:hypothetical protein
MEGGAAYKQLQVPKDTVSQGLQHWGQIEAQKRAEEKKAEEREKVRGEQEEEGREKRVQEGINKYQTDITALMDMPTSKFKNIREGTTDYAIRNTKYVAEQNKLAADAHGKGNFEDARTYAQNAKWAEAAIENVKKTLEASGKYYTDFAESGKKMSGFSAGLESNMEAFNLENGQIFIEYNPETRQNEFYLIRKDKETGEDIRTKHTEKELLHGEARYVERQNLVKDVGDIVGNIGKDITDTGYSWGSSQEDTAKGYIDSKLTSDDYMADMVDQFNLYEHKDFNLDKNLGVVPKFTEKQRGIVRDLFVKKVETAYGSRYSKPTNTEIETNKTKGSLIRPMLTADNKPTNKFSLGYTDKGVHKGLTGILGKDLTAEVKNIEYFKNDDGTYMFRATISTPNKPEGKGEAKEVSPEEYEKGSVGDVITAILGKGDAARRWYRDVVTLNEEDLGRVAEGLGLNSRNQLPDYLNLVQTGGINNNNSGTSGGGDPLNLFD